MSIPGLEEHNSGSQIPPFTIRDEIIRQGTWVVSRLLFVVGVVVISLTMKEQVEDVIQRALLTDDESLRQQARIKSIEEIRGAFLVVQNASSSYQNLYQSLIRSHGAKRIRVDQRLLRIAEIRYNELDSALYARTTVWEGEFSKALSDLHYRIGQGLELAREINNGITVSDDVFVDLEIINAILAAVHQRIEVSYRKALQTGATGRLLNLNF